MTHRVLFLCTGNYFRSRFAEMLFNVRASCLRLNWLADSRGIATESGTDNLGAISVHAVNGLRARGIAVDSRIHFPIQLEEQDLAQADLIIALDEAEHRPLLEKRFPAWPDRVEYWRVPDLDRASSEEALSTIEREMDSLMRRLSKH